MLSESSKILILRDWRFGSAYGTIDGGISVEPSSSGYIVSFKFESTHYEEVMPL